MRRWFEQRTGLDILVLSRCPPWPLDRGDRLIVYHLAEELARRGHTFDLLAFYDHPYDPADVPAYDRLFREVRLLPERARSPWQYLARRLRPRRRFPTQARECWSPPMWKAVAGQLRSATYDLVFFFGGVAVYEYYPLVRHIPNLITPYESYALYLEREARNARNLAQKLGAWARLNMARAYECWMFDPFGAVVVVSERDAATLRALNPSLPVTVIPNGVDVERFAPTIEGPKPPTLIFTGNFAYPPNVDAALVLAREVLPRVQQKVPGARLKLVGANPPPEVRALECAAITVTGRVPDMHPYLDQAAVYVCPLRLGAGIKNKVLEAMAMALPVVATPLSCDGIDAADGREVLLAEGPAALAEGVVRVLTDPDLSRRLAHNASALVRSGYTWRSVADRYEALFEQVILAHR